VVARVDVASRHPDLSIHEAGSIPYTHCFALCLLYEYASVQQVIAAASIDRRFCRTDCHDVHQRVDLPQYSLARSTFARHLDGYFHLLGLERCRPDALLHFVCQVSDQMREIEGCAQSSDHGCRRTVDPGCPFSTSSLKPALAPLNISGRLQSLARHNRLWDQSTAKASIPDPARRRYVSAASIPLCIVCLSPWNLFRPLLVSERSIVACAFQYAARLYGFCPLCRRSWYSPRPALVR
jgi:hypothetical protein